MKRTSVAVGGGMVNRWCVADDLVPLVDVHDREAIGDVQGSTRRDASIRDECIDLCNDIIFGETPAIVRPFRMAVRVL